MEVWNAEKFPTDLTISEEPMTHETSNINLHDHRGFVNSCRAVLLNRKCMNAPKFFRSANKY
jgi:hypothetical protein